VKVAADHDAVRAALAEDAEALGTVEQVDTYFDAPHRDFAATDEALRLRRERDLAEAGDVPSDDAFPDSDAALAGGDDAAEDADDASADADAAPADSDDAAADSDGEAGDASASDWTTAVTYKGPLVEAESKTREEFETGVEDGEELEAVLERLGFAPAAEVRKRRERHRIGEFTVTLDAVEGLGEYVEVETEVDGAEDVAAARDRARTVLRDLDCDPDDQIRTSYLGLLLATESG